VVTGNRVWLRAIVIRAVICGATCLGVLSYCIDVRSLLPGNSTVPRLSEEHASADPGWPHLRGPRYDAQSADTGLVDSWPSEGPPILWNREIGCGYSALIAVGSRVYTQTQNLTDQTVLALDAVTGQTIWQHRYGWPYEPGGMYPGPRATPTWANGRVYFSGPDGLVGCLRASDGQPLWSINVLQQFDGRGADFGYACSPLVEDGKVILPVGGTTAAVAALNAEDGTVVWTSGAAPASYCSAIPITFRGNRQVVAFLQNELTGFDLHTGQLLWQQSYPHGYNEHAAFPLYAEPYLRTMQPFRAGSDLFELVDVERASEASERAGCRLKTVRHDPQMSNDVASSVLVDGHVYGFDIRGAQPSRHRSSRGAFRCMDFKTGETRWSSDRLGQATIAVADGRLILLDDRGEIVLVRVNSERYEELARANIFPGEVCWTAPSLHRNCLYVRSPTRAACVYLGNPEVLSVHQKATANAARSVSVPLQLDWLIGDEREFPFELPDLEELLMWYLCSLGVIATSGVIATGIRAICQFGLGNTAHKPVQAAFWLGVLILGIAATPLGNHYSSRFVFTWPVSLFGVHQIALAAVLWSKQPGRGNVSAWIGAAGVACFAIACFAYYGLTRRFSLAPAWYYLATFLAGWPLAVPAARKALKSGRLLNHVVWLSVSFSLYFWVTGGVMIWRAAVRR